jgi:hypothetical protein
VASSEQFNILSSPFLAIMQADLSNLFKSKLTYGWLIAGLFLVVIRVLSSRVGGTMSSTVAAGFSDFLLIWSMIIIGLTASAVSSEAGEFADSIMSKSVTRFDYIFAKFASRILYVLTIFGAISLISTGLSWKLLSNDYQTYGFIYSILLIILILTTIIAIISLLIIWYFMVFFFPLADLGFLSPSTIANELPNNIQGIWSIDTWQTVTGFAAISIAATSLSAIYFFFKDV